MYVLVLRPYRKDNIYFRTIEEREKIKAFYIAKMHYVGHPIKNETFSPAH